MRLECSQKAEVMDPKILVNNPKIGSVQQTLVGHCPDHLPGANQHLSIVPMCHA